MAGMAWSDKELEFLFALRGGGHSWEEIAEQIRKKFGREANWDNVRHVHRMHKHRFDTTSEESALRNLKLQRSARKTASFNSRNLNLTLDAWQAQDDLLEQIKSLVKNLHKRIRISRFRRAKNRHKMIMELLISDVHYGALTEREGKQIFNLEICRRRMRELARVTLIELENNRKSYSVEKLVIALLGDIIESSTIHEMESMVGCEFTNSAQIHHAIESLLEDIIIPLAKTGIPIEIPAVTGNHDRTHPQKTMTQPGKHNVTWIIYNTLKLFCTRLGLNNVKFFIPEDCFIVRPIFGNKVLYEHCDEVNAPTEKALEDLLARRSRECGERIDFLRGGHWHADLFFNRGRLIINSSVKGQDGYARTKGYASYPGQVLNFYLDVYKEPNCFFKGFPVYLP